MTLNTVEITRPEISYPLPSDHQELMNLFYGHYQALTAKVRENNASICEGCDDIWIAPGLPGMLRAPHQEEIAAVMPPKVNAAVILGNFNYQVGNGGWLQWDDNGYSSSVEALLALYKGAASIGIEHADEVVTMIEEFISRKATSESISGAYYEEDEFEFYSYDDLCTRYYALDGEKIMQDILDRFDDVAGGAFMAGAYKKAA